MANFVIRILKRLWRLRPIEIRRRRPARRPPEGRFSYQQKFVDFGLRPGDRVLDIGSGHHPFPAATVLTDRFLDRNVHRKDALARDGRPLVVSDVQALPFKNKSFDFVFCSHVLEHVDRPEEACAELIRVARRGYVETPTLAKDILFSWTEEMHRWHIVVHGKELHFFECTDRQRRGTGSDAWRRLIRDHVHHPLQDLFYENMDLFNNLILWEDDFTCVVHRLPPRKRS